MELSNRYYCSQKFWWLSVDLQKMETMSCGAATPQKIEQKYFKENSRDIFNAKHLQQDRQEMLSGKKVRSCSATCWAAEEAGLPSRRTIMGSNAITHTEINSIPDVLHIILGNHCNMTCSYCCKQYSSAWYRDIKEKGKYNIESHDDRFKITNKDKLFSQISQKKINERKDVQLILEELQKISKTGNLSELQITGGEPFLHIILNDILDMFQSSKKINIFTGLGISSARFITEITKLKKYSDSLMLTISAENTKNFYEFNRAGNSWKQFEENIKCLKENKINYKFSSVLSNLTIFGLEEFEDFAKGHKIDYHVCSDPDFLSLHVLDLHSKESIIEKISQNNSPAKNIIIQCMDKNPTAIQYKNFSNYIKEFAKRRNKNLLIFPKTMLDWIETSKDKF